MVSPEGAVLDVNPELPAAKAGLAPGMKIRRSEWTRNGRAEALHDAIAATKNATMPHRVARRVMAASRKATEWLIAAANVIHILDAMPRVPMCSVKSSKPTPLGTGVIAALGQR